MCDIIITHVKDRFSFCNHLIVAKLFCCENFTTYRNTSSDNDFKTTGSTYAALNQYKLKSEFSVIYNRDDFKNANSAIAILQLFYNYLSEASLSQNLCTIPMTSVESERCFPTLNRIKTFLRSTMSQDRLNAPSVLSIEKKNYTIIVLVK